MSYVFVNSLKVVKKLLLCQNVKEPSITVTSYHTLRPSSLLPLNSLNSFCLRACNMTNRFRVLQMKDIKSLTKCHQVNQCKVNVTNYSRPIFRIIPFCTDNTKLFCLWLLVNVMFFIDVHQSITKLFENGHVKW